jgi:hypothetical protein
VRGLQPRPEMELRALEHASKLSSSAGLAQALAVRFACIAAKPTARSRIAEAVERRLCVASLDTRARLGTEGPEKKRKKKNFARNGAGNENGILHVALWKLPATCLLYAASWVASRVATCRDATSCGNARCGETPCNVGKGGEDLRWSLFVPRRAVKNILPLSNAETDIAAR